MHTLLVLALGWLLLAIAFLGLRSPWRSLEYRERMAMSAHGITPPATRRKTLPQPLLLRQTGILQGGVMTALVGLALTLGLYPIGCIVPPDRGGSSHFGPWLLAGLIPLVVGSALIMGQYLPPGHPGAISPGAGTDQPDGQTSLSQERAVSSEPASERGEPRALPYSGGHGATEPERTQNARCLQQERHDGTRAFRSNPPVMVCERLASPWPGYVARPLSQAGSR